MQSSMFGLTKSKTVVAIAVTVILGLGLSNTVISSSAAVNTRVAVGGNGSAWDTYTPQSVEINAGDSVTWYNPSPVTEPHTTTFLTNQSYFPPLAAPFNIPSNTETVSRTQITLCQELKHILIQALSFHKDSHHQGHLQ